jgi:hypothetical protein
MIGRVEMGAVVGRERDGLHRPGLSFRQILRLQPLKEAQHPRQALLVIVVFDHGMNAGGIGGYVVLQRNGNVDQFSRHGVASGDLVFVWRWIIRFRPA